MLQERLGNVAKRQAWMASFGMRTPKKKSIFTQKVPINFTARNLKVRTIETDQELSAIRRLRYGVFHREFAGKIMPFGSDRDAYDYESDILVIEDVKNGRFVGTYRIICSLFSDNFYSASEFDLGNLLDRPGPHMELSRACIHKDYRNGAVLSLLWKGVLRYLKEVNARTLFGCSSIQTMSIEKLMQIFCYFESMGLLDLGSNVSTRHTYRIEGFMETYRTLLARCQTHGAEEGGNDIPPLLKSYLRAGAQICSPPALDISFRCTDFLTVLDLDRINQRFERKYAS